MTDTATIVSSDLPFDADQWARLEAALPPGRVIKVDTGDDAAVAAALEVAEIAILKGDLDERFVNAPGLKWVHCDHAGLTKSARPEVFRERPDRHRVRGALRPSPGRACDDVLAPAVLALPGFL
ncbi:hypothetical protein QW131_31350 [Roseibium salinum]|nr:hypothetical protein [Roseibium salinum]